MVAGVSTRKSPALRAANCPIVELSAGEVPTDQETFVAKPNYHHARNKRELARKARRQEKRRRRSARPSAGGENLETTQSCASAAPSNPTSGGTSGSGA
jgi:hypothetical protein